MDNLNKLQQRKAALKVELDQQRGEMKNTLQEIREEIDPGALLKKAVSSALGFSGSKDGKTGSLLSRLPGPVSFLVDLLVRDPKWALGLKLAGPVIMKFWPKGSEPASDTAGTGSPKPPKKTIKRKIFGGIREGIAAFRGKIRKKPESPEPDL